MATTTASAAARADAPTFPWWLVLLEGIFAAIFGLLLLIAPGATLFFVVQVLSFYLLIGGIFRLISVFSDRSLWGWKLLAGILGIIAGIVVLQHPLLSTILVPLYVVYLVSFLAIIQGVIGLIHAFQGEGWNGGLLGILSLVLGLIVVLNPLIGLVAMPFVLGAFMLVGGGAAIAISLRMRSSSPATTGS
jgi:uncharacterized membrane protein HdeD (DUF308 family)